MHIKGRVIITSSRNLMSLVIARSLGERNIEIIGADCIDITMLSMSKYVEHHEVYSNYLEDKKAFIDDLLSIVKKHKPDDDRPYLLIPVFKETEIIAEHAELFKDHITLACPSYECISKVHPKDNFTRTTKELGISIPGSYLPADENDLDAIAGSKGFPLIIKPYNDSGGRGILKVNSEKELKKAFKDNVGQYNEAPLVQEYIDAEDFCLTTIFRDGSLIGSMAYKNIHHFPDESGSGIMRETVDEKPFEAEAIKLLGAIKWNGVAQIDFMWNGNSRQKPVMIEINPRFWAGLHQSVHSGIDYPWLIYLLYTGQDLPDPGKPEIGVKTKIPAVWMLSVIKESFNLEESFGKIKEAGRAALDEYKENKNITGAFGSLFHDLKDSLKPAFRKQEFISKWQEARNAGNEIFSNDDPKAALGITYSLFYLAKYGKLPPETGI